MRLVVGISCCLCLCWLHQGSKNDDNSQRVFQGEEASSWRSNRVRGAACIPILDLRKDLCAWKLLKYYPCASIGLMRDFAPTYRLFLAEATMASTAKTAGVISGVSCNSCFSFITVLGLTSVVSPGLPQTCVTRSPGCGAGRHGLTPSSATNQMKRYCWLCCFPSAPGTAGWQQVAHMGCHQMISGDCKRYLQSSSAHIASLQR